MTISAEYRSKATLPRQLKKQPNSREENENVNSLQTYRQKEEHLDGGQKVIRTAFISLKVVRFTQNTINAVFETNKMI